MWCEVRVDYFERIRTDQVILSLNSPLRCDHCVINSATSREQYSLKWIKYFQTFFIYTPRTFLRSPCTTQWTGAFYFFKFRRYFRTG